MHMHRNLGRYTLGLSKQRRLAGVGLDWPVAPRHTRWTSFWKPLQESSHLDTRHVTVMTPSRTTAKHGQPGCSTPSAHRHSSPYRHVGQRRHATEQQTLYYNPLAELWHAFRGQQVVEYVQFFNQVVAQSCLSATPRYIHQLLAFPNAGWDESKYAVDASLQASTQALADVRLGVSLYGDASYGPGFTQWLQTADPRPYGVTEFHPLRPLDGPTMQQVLAQHAVQGAQFVSFFMEPRWQGVLAPRPHNPFSFDPENTHYDSDALYRSIDWVRLHGRGHQFLSMRARLGPSSSNAERWHAGATRRANHAKRVLLHAALGLAGRAAHTRKSRPNSP